MDIVLYLFRALIDFFTALLLLRFFMQMNRVSFTNPLGTFVMTMTSPVVLPLRRIIPGFFRLDLASLLPAFLLQAIFWLVLIQNIDALWVAGLAVIRLSIYIFQFALIIIAVLSWVSPHSPLGYPLAQLTAPLLNPIRRILPPIAGVDLSPLIAILVLQALLMALYKAHGFML